MVNSLICNLFISGTHQYVSLSPYNWLSNDAIRINVEGNEGNKNRVSSSGDTLAFKPLIADPDPAVPWYAFSFGLNRVQTDSIWISCIDAPPNDTNDDSTSFSFLYSSGSSTCLIPGHTTLSLHPTATILNYGQGLYEGLKDFHHASGTITQFCPDANMQQCSNSVKQLVVSLIPSSTFVMAHDQVIHTNA